MKELQESDLQVGDILIFENQDFSYSKFYSLCPSLKDSADKEKWMPAAFYLLVYMIPWFDPGDDPKNYKNIYHAAIWGNVNVNLKKMGAPVEYGNRIVQAGPRGIVQDSLQETLVGPGVKNIYVYRYKGKNADFANKINEQIRNFYNDISIPYSYETAWLLAVICSMRYSDGALYEILKEKIGKWGADLMIGVIQDMINQYNNDHQKEMVACSTLVAMIYKDADYPLEIKEFEKEQQFHIPIDFNAMPQKLTIEEVNDKNLPKFATDKTIVTPRQLFESSSVEEVGYLPFKG